MLTETLLSFEQWRNTLLTEGAKDNGDVTEQNRQYERYCANFHGQKSQVQKLNEG